jgi:cytochrome c oxidase subunit 1
MSFFTVASIMIAIPSGLQIFCWIATLEWATSSPPPAYNFSALPVVASAYPLWDLTGQRAVVVGLPTSARTTLVTTLNEARPDHIAVLPDSSIWPLVTSIAVTVLFIGSIFTPWAVVWGSIPVGIAMIGWFWPKKAENRKHCELEVKPADAASAEFREVEVPA